MARSRGVDVVDVTIKQLLEGSMAENFFILKDLFRFRVVAKFFRQIDVLDG